MSQPTTLPSGTTTDSLAASIAGARPEYTPEQAQQAAEVLAQLAEVKREAIR